jgi:hypothetical protein
MNLELAGKWLLIFGLGLAVCGALLWLLGKALPNLTQFPGTIKIQTSGLTCVVPLLAMILISVVLTVILNLAARFLNK